MRTDAWSVTDGFEDGEKVWHETPPETRAALHRAMGVEPGQPASDADPVRVVRQGAKRPRTTWRGELKLEDGTSQKLDGPLPADLPLGYHAFHANGADHETRLIVAPAQCPMPDGRKWGWSAQLYAARSKQSWGMGDLADLRRLAHWAAGQGADLLLVNPLGASSPAGPQQPSPYYPMSRRFRNPLYLCIEELPGVSGIAQDIEPLAAQGRQLNSDPRIDRDAVFRLKQQALEKLWRASPDLSGLDAYCRTQGKELEQFAVFCTLAERFGVNWRDWPSEYRQPAHAAVGRWGAEHADRVRYHMWLQWLVDEQLRRASAGIAIMHDLPIGVDSSGADAWVWQDVLATGSSVGAPPDIYNAQGQDWGLPPFIPHKLRAAGYEPFIQTIRSVLGHAGALRIDHVMGLFRLFWIPQGFGPDRGAFVRYRSDELLAIVALESHRAGAYVVGEDLGTVEDGVREQLADWRVLSYRLLWFEDQPPTEYPKLAMVAATTHDLPTIAGLWSGNDWKAQRKAGIAGSEEVTDQIRDRLKKFASLEGDEPVEEVIRRAYRLLGQSPSLVVSATLEDAMASEHRPNMPGTVDEWPNWSVALPRTVEELEASPLADEIAAALRPAPKSTPKPPLSRRGREVSPRRK